MYAVLKTALKLLLRRGVRNSYGQFGEDAIVQALLKSKKGRYVDVGAFDPVLYSNTYALYRRGWRGIAIDPNPALARMYRIFRPRDTFVCAGIGKDGEGTYHMLNDASYNTFDKNAAARWQRERGLRLKRTVQVPFMPLGQILKAHNVEQIDFLNIDVEGMDIVVLQSHDWSVMPKVIAVEDDEFNADTPEGSEVYQFLRDKGYVLQGFSKQTLVFVKKSAV